MTEISLLTKSDNCFHVDNILEVNFNEIKFIDGYAEILLVRGHHQYVVNSDKTIYWSNYNARAKYRIYNIGYGNFVFRNNSDHMCTHWQINEDSKTLEEKKRLYWGDPEPITKYILLIKGNEKRYVLIDSATPLPYDDIYQIKEGTHWAIIKLRNDHELGCVINEQGERLSEYHSSFGSAIVGEKLKDIIDIQNEQLRRIDEKKYEIMFADYKKTLTPQ